MSRITTRADAPVVHLDGSTTIEAALVRFKKSVSAAQIFQEIRKRAYFVPPSARRRLKAQKSRARLARAARRAGPDRDWKPERSG